MDRGKNKLMRVALTTLGCRFNQVEGAEIETILNEHDFKLVPFSSAADVYVINTCSVTAKGEYRSRQAIRRARQINQQAFIVVTGCYAQLRPQEIGSLKGVNLILGNEEKFRLPFFLQRIKKNGPPAIFKEQLSSSCNFSRAEIKNISGRDQILPRVKGFVKIQNGCNQRCTYCSVWISRGKERSASLKSILSQVETLLNNGYKEIVLTGINIGNYGRSLSPSLNLSKLLRSLLQLEHLPRIRLSSLSPGELNQELIDLIVSSPRICRHLHLSLQSGDPWILSRMKREYDPEEVRKMVTRLKETIPDLALGMDIMVGFPGEEEKNFWNTYNLVRDLPLSYLHVFKYSIRPGTPAALFSGQVSGPIKKERSRIIRELGREKNLLFRKTQLGKIREVLIEGRDKITGLYKGDSENFIPCFVPAGEDLVNELIRVKVKELLGVEGIQGEIWP